MGVRKSGRSKVRKKGRLGNDECGMMNESGSREDRKSERLEGIMNEESEKSIMKIKSARRVLHYGRKWI